LFAIHLQILAIDLKVYTASLASSSTQRTNKLFQRSHSEFALPGTFDYHTSSQIATSNCSVDLLCLRRYPFVDFRVTKVLKLQTQFNKSSRKLSKTRAYLLGWLPAYPRGWKKRYQVPLYSSIDKLTPQELQEVSHQGWSIFLASPMIPLPRQHWRKQASLSS
jgi:hypothetical protein